MWKGLRDWDPMMQISFHRSQPSPIQFHGSTEVSPDAKSHALSRAERRKLKDQASLLKRHGKLPEIAEVSHNYQNPVREV